MASFPRRAKIFVVFVAVIVGSYAIANLFGGSISIPVEFSNARLQGALIAQDIVNLSNQSVRDLEQINRFDQEKKYKEAINLASRSVLTSRNIRDQAAELSTQIEKMTRSLSDIESLKVRQAALESITNHLSLISRLVSYSASLSQLLDTLRDRFSGVPGDHQIAGVITQINVEVAAINSFNSQAMKAMEEFDRLVK